MDTIRIDNLVFLGKHGVSEKERNLEQEFEVSVTLGVDVKKSALSDKIEDTVDYQNIKDIVREVIEGSACYLIEKLASDIAGKILKEDGRIKNTTISIRKIHIWDNGVPSVTITRDR